MLTSVIPDWVGMLESYGPGCSQQITDIDEINIALDESISDSARENKCRHTIFHFLVLAHTVDQPVNFERFDARAVGVVGKPIAAR